MTPDVAGLRTLAQQRDQWKRRAMNAYENIRRLLVEQQVQRARADRAEAAIARCLSLLDARDRGFSQIDTDEVRAALDVPDHTGSER